MASEELQMLRVEIVSPATKPLELEAVEVILPGQSGVLSIRGGHTPLMTTLRSGVLALAGREGTDTCFAVHGGFAEVLDNGIRILTPQYEPGDAIDADRAREAQERAEQRLATKEKDTDVQRAEAALHRAMARLGAHQREAF